MLENRLPLALLLKVQFTLFARLRKQVWVPLQKRFGIIRRLQGIYKLAEIFLLRLVDVVTCWLIARNLYIVSCSYTHDGRILSFSTTGGTVRLKQFMSLDLSMVQDHNTNCNVGTTRMVSLSLKMWFLSCSCVNNLEFNTLIDDTNAVI